MCGNGLKLYVMYYSEVLGCRMHFTSLFYEMWKSLTTPGSMFVIFHFKVPIKVAMGARNPF